MGEVEQYALKRRICLRDARQKRPTPAGNVDKSLEPAEVLCGEDVG
jgi:hypothetical protein